MSDSATNWARRADAARAKLTTAPTADSPDPVAAARYDEEIRALVAEGRPADAKARRAWHERIASAFGNRKSAETGSGWYMPVESVAETFEALHAEGVAVARAESDADAQVIRAAGFSQDDVREMLAAGCSHADILAGARLFARAQF